MPFSNDYPSYMQSSAPVAPNMMNSIPSTSFDFYYPLNACHRSFSMYNTRFFPAPPPHVLSHSNISLDTSLTMPPAPVAHLPLLPQASFPSEANATEDFFSPNTSSATYAHFRPGPREMYLLSDATTPHYIPTPMAPQHQLWDPSYLPAVAPEPGYGYRHSQSQQSSQTCDSAYVQPTTLMSAPSSVQLQPEQSSESWYSSYEEPSTSIQGLVPCSQSPSNLLAPPQPPFQSAPLQRQQRKRHLTASSDSTDASFTDFSSQEGTDTDATSTKTTPELPQKPIPRNTQQQATQVLGKRSRPIEPWPAPEVADPSLSIEDAIPRVVEWLEIGIAFVYADKGPYIRASARKKVKVGRSKGREGAKVGRSKSKKGRGKSLSDVRSPGADKETSEHRRNPGWCPYCRLHRVRLDQMPTHASICKQNHHAIIYSTSGLSIKTLAQAWIKGKIRMSWSSEFQTAAECVRLTRIMEVGTSSGNWNVTAFNKQARQECILKQALRQVDKTIPPADGPSTSSPVPTGFQHQFQVHNPGPSQLSVPNEQLVPERRMGEGLDMTQQVGVKRPKTAPRAKGKATKTNAKVPVRKRQQKSRPSGSSASVGRAPSPSLVAAGQEQVIPSLPVLIPSPTTACELPANTDAADPIPPFDFTSDDALGVSAVLSAIASSNVDLTAEALFKSIFGDEATSPVGSTHTHGIYSSLHSRGPQATFDDTVSIPLPAADDSSKFTDSAYLPTQIWGHDNPIPHCVRPEDTYSSPQMTSTAPCAFLSPQEILAAAFGFPSNDGQSQYDNGIF